MAANMRAVICASALLAVLAASHQQHMRGHMTLDQSSHDEGIFSNVFESIANALSGDWSKPVHHAAALSEETRDMKNNVTKGQIFSVPLNSELQEKSDIHPAKSASVGRHDPM